MGSKKTDMQIRDILEARERMFMGQWEHAHVGAENRLNRLSSLLARANGDEEIFRHIVVSSISALETFHKATVVDVVNKNTEFQARAAEELTIKLSLSDALSWFEGREVTFGEMVAHVIPFGKVEHLVGIIETLLKIDIREEASSLVSPWDLRNQVTDAPRIVNDVESFLRNLSDAFKLRHILAHEAASELRVSEEEARSVLSAVKVWAEAIDALLWKHVHTDLPLTQFEMNVHAGKSVERARSELAKQMCIARKVARRENCLPWLLRNHMSWKSSLFDWAEHTYGNQLGTMWPAVRASDMAANIRHRVRQIRSWNQFM